MKTGIYLGRFQPPHVGHAKCVQHILKECDRCVILFRDTEMDASNPLGVKKRMKLFRELLTFADEEKVLMGIIPDDGCDLTVYIGREVGYGLIRLDEKTEGIHAADLRKKLYEKS